jgi:hypothetical protein
MAKCLAFALESGKSLRLTSYLELFTARGRMDFAASTHFMEGKHEQTFGVRVYLRELGLCARRTIR